MDPGLVLTFVGGGRGAEREIMAREAVRYVPMRIEGLKGRGPRPSRGRPAAGRLPEVARPPRAAAAAARRGRRRVQLRPIVLLAAWAAVPTLILEQNVRPGFTNRLLIRWVKKAAVAFAASLPYFRGKGVHLGNPVRPEFAALPAKARRRRPVAPCVRREPGFPCPQPGGRSGPAPAGARSGGA